MSAWDNLIGLKRFIIGGVELVQRQRIKFVGDGVSGADDDANDCTVITITGAAGSDLSDANPRPLGDVAPGAGTTGSRSDHVHAHGDQPGGSLHKVAVGGATPVAGFMSGPDKVSLDAIAAAFAAMPAASYNATPDTLARRIKTGDASGDPAGSLRMVDSIVSGDSRVTGNSSCSGNATIAGTLGVTGVCTAGGLVSPTLSHAAADVTISAPGSGKVAIINGANGVVVRKGGLNVCIIGDTLSPSVSQWFQPGFDPVISQYAAVSGTGRSLTIQGQNVTTGTGGHLILKAGIGSTKAGETQLSGDVIRGLSNEFAWMTLDTFTKVLANSTDGITLAGKGIKLQVNDATVPATVRTPLEITREALGPGTAEQINVAANVYVGANKIGGSATACIEFGANNVHSTTGQHQFYLGGFQKFTVGSGFITITPGPNAASNGAIRANDGEILNAKGSGGSEVCLISYDRTLTSAVFGSDSAKARSASTAVLAGSTSAQLAVNGTAVIEARAGQAKVIGAQFCEEVATSATISATTATLDGALGNVHIVPLSATSTCTISLSNTKKGAEMEFFFTKSSGGVGITLSPTWFDMGLAVDYANPTGSISNVIAFGSRTRIYIRGRVQADGGKVFVTHHVEN